MVSTLFVRSFQGPYGQTHTHKPRKGVRGRRSHRHISHTLSGASLKRCGVRGGSAVGGFLLGGPLASPVPALGRGDSVLRTARRARAIAGSPACPPPGASVSACAVGVRSLRPGALPLRAFLLAFSSLLVRSHEAHQSASQFSQLYRTIPHNQSEDRALVRIFHQTRLKSTCTGGVPCVSRLPPVSFYRRRALVSDRHSKKGFVKKVVGERVSASAEQPRRPTRVCAHQAALRTEQPSECPRVSTL